MALSVYLVILQICVHFLRTPDWLVSSPSMQASSWFSVCSTSSFDPPSRSDRCLPSVSSSSMNMIQGAYGGQTSHHAARKAFRLALAQYGNGGGRVEEAHGLWQ